MSTLVINNESIAAYETLLNNPGEHGLPFRPLEQCFRPCEEAKPKHLLYKDFLEEVPACPKVIFYIVMDKKYAQYIKKAPTGEMGYALEFVKNDNKTETGNEKHTT